MRKWVAALGLCLLLATGRGALAATATDGTLITNVATGSFQSAAGVQFWISYAVTATVIVSNPCVALKKTASPTIQSSGGIVTFLICAVNCSDTSSSFNVIVTDRVPDWMANVDNALYAPATWYGSGMGVLWTESSSSTYAGPYAPGLVLGQGAPYFNRFSLPMLGPKQSTCVAWRASVL